MKKLNFKALLVLVLVLVLVLSVGLTACSKKNNNSNNPVNPVGPGGNTPGGGDNPGGDNPGGDNPGGDDEITAATYFTNLWAISNSIGGQEITPNDNVGLSLDLSLDVNMLKPTGAFDSELISLGVRLDVILDRSSRDDAGAPLATYSAVRAQVYDPSKTEDDSLFAVYYFLDDPTHVYFDLGFAQNVDVLADNGILADRFYKIEFVTDNNGNRAYAGAVADFVLHHEFKLNEGEVDDNGKSKEIPFTIADIVDGLIKGTGEDWTLNDMVQGVLDVFKLDLSILSMFDGYDAINKKIALENVLSNELITDFMENVRTERISDNEFKYYADMDLSDVLGAVSSLVTIDNPLINSILAGLDLSFEYGEKNGDINGFAIILGLEGFADDNTGLYPQLRLAINNLELRKVAGTATAIRQKVDFDSTKWANCGTLNLNTFLNAMATMQIEVWDHVAESGSPDVYLCTAYSDIDLIEVIKGIVKIVKRVGDDDIEGAVGAFRNIHSEAGFKVEKMKEEGGKLVVDEDAAIPFQILASCPEAQLSVVIGGQAYIIDGADLLTHIDEIVELCSQFMGGDEVEETPTAGGDNEDGGLDIMAVIDALKLVLDTIKIGGEPVSLDVLKATFLDADGNLKENWHEFTLDANFTKEICDQLATAFGGENANAVSVNIQKAAKSIHARAEYKNNAGYEADGKTVKMATYFVDVVSSWDVDERECKLTLVFTAWDEDSSSIHQFELVIDGVVDAQAAATAPAKITITDELLNKVALHVNLTEYALKADGTKDTTAAEEWFDAVLKVDVSYKGEAASKSIDQGTLSLVVTKAGTELVHIYGELKVTAGTVLVRFTDDGIKYSANNATVDAFIRGNVISTLAQLEVAEDVELREVPLPDAIVDALKLPDGSTIGDLLGVAQIKTEGENVINTHYVSVNATAGDHELFTLGINEYAYDATEQEYVATGDTLHLVLETRRVPDAEHADEFKNTYIRVCVATPDPDDATKVVETGLALRLDTWQFEHDGSCYLRYDAEGNFLGGLVKAPSRTGATILNWAAIKAMLDDKA